MSGLTHNSASSASVFTRTMHTAIYHQGDHLKADCPAAVDEPPVCCNCGGVHPANWGLSTPHHPDQHHSSQKNHKVEHMLRLSSPAGRISHLQGRRYLEPGPLQPLFQAFLAQVTAQKAANPGTMDVLEALTADTKNKKKRPRNSKKPPIPAPTLCTPMEQSAPAEATTKKHS